MSRGPTPLASSPYDPRSDSEESWQFIDYSSTGSGPSSIGFLPSPASGSLNGFAIVGRTGGHVVVATPESPAFLDLDQPQFPVDSAVGFADAMSDNFVSPGVSGSPSAQSAQSASSLFMQQSGAATAGSMGLTPQTLLFPGAQMNDMNEMNGELVGLVVSQH